MARIDLEYNVFKHFFDRDVVRRRLGAKQAAKLSRAGSFVRRTARTLLRTSGKGNASARPGEPPRRHQGGLRDNVLFAYKPTNDSVVVGARLFRGASNPPVPGLLEAGGIAEVTERVQVYRNGVKVWRRTRNTTMASYAPHPFMAPALEENAPKFPGIWADTL